MLNKAVFIKSLFICLLACVIMGYSPQLAAKELYPFSSQVKAQRFKKLTWQLRCLVCQNQNLAESDAALAAQLRQDIYQKVLNGQSNKQIINYLVTRYGDFVLYKPPVQRNTLLLWFGPLLLFIFGFMILFYIIKKQRRTTTVKSELSIEEQQRLQALLNKDNAPS